MELKQHLVHRCRLCGSQNLEDVLTLERSPRCISRLLTTELVKLDQPVSLEIRKCQSCNFVQSLPGESVADYNDYILSWMHLKTMLEHRTSLCADYVNRFDRQGKSILDVGCGSGEFMEILRGHGVHACGIEPSVPLAAKAMEKKFEVICDFVSKEALETNPPQLDGFTCLQVLEHIPDPVGFLRTLRNALKPDGVGLVEVPSLERILEDRRLYEFFADHVNYFTMGTLTSACELAGFQVIDTCRGFDRQFLIAFVTPADVSSTEAFLEMRQSLDTARDWVLEQQREGHKIAAWGAGYKSTAAVAELDLPCLECVIDSDVSKHGLFMPVSHLEVVSPEELGNRAISAVLITAVAYKMEIASFLINQLGFRGKIAALGRNIEVLQG